eukprot:1161325-Pelagomonas_calceolata.AAC.30
MQGMRLMPGSRTMYKHKARLLTIGQFAPKRSATCKQREIVHRRALHKQTLAPSKQIITTQLHLREQHHEQLLWQQPNISNANASLGSPEGLQQFLLSAILVVASQCQQCHCLT